MPRKKTKSKRKQPYKYGVPAKYTKGAKNPRKKAAEIKHIVYCEEDCNCDCCDDCC